MSNIIPFLPAIVILSVHSLQAETEAVLRLDRKLPKAEIRIWSPLFQAGWDKLESIHETPLERTSLASLAMTSLDNFKWNEKKVMPSGRYKLYAGKLTQKFITDTSASMLKDFGEPLDTEGVDPDAGGLAVFSVLKQKLSFPKPFFDSRKKDMTFTDGKKLRHKVKFFGTAGVSSKKFRDQVQILSYKNKGTSFCLKFKTKVKDQSLIVYLPDSTETFKSAIEKVNKELKTPLI